MRKTLYKSELADIFGLRAASGRIYYTKLRELYFTDEALNKLGISPEDYAKVRQRPFDYIQTQRIIEFFNITPEEIMEA
ncbi:MAG: hypothetical protein AAFU67_01715, partial [Bacteroidota bacterium]